jgi:hypothetical protein
MGSSSRTENPFRASYNDVSALGHACQCRKRAVQPPNRQNRINPASVVRVFVQKVRTDPDFPLFFRLLNISTSQLLNASTNC